MSQPCPASTDFRPRTSRKNARSFSASLVYIRAWMALIIAGLLRSGAPSLPETTGDREPVPPLPARVRLVAELDEQLAGDGLELRLGVVREVRAPIAAD